MKHPTSYAQPRRLARPRKKRQDAHQLDLRPRSKREREPQGEIEIESKNTFWKWVGIVALVHLVAIILFGLFHDSTPKPTPPEQMISLVPPGDVVKGTPGPTEAPKLGPTTPAPTKAAPPPEAVHPPTPVQPKPAPVKPKPKPVVKADVPKPVPDKPVVEKPVVEKTVADKPTPPKPKVKVDLTLADGPAPAKPVTKPKTHKKPVTTTTTDDSSARDTTSNPDTDGLSKDQIAQKLGQKLKASGVENAVNHGASGSKAGQTNPFQDFYLSVRDQVMNKWVSPNLADETAVTPEVTIHVEKDGRVPPELVTLTRSSGNQAYDDSALAAAKSLGYLLQPLPDGCPPDIHINFKLNH